MKWLTRHLSIIYVYKRVVFSPGCIRNTEYLLAILKDRQFFVPRPLPSSLNQTVRGYKIRFTSHTSSNQIQTNSNLSIGQVQVPQ